MPASGGGKPRPPSIGSGPLEELVGRKECEPFRRAARLGCGLPRVTLRRAPEAARCQRAEGESLALLRSGPVRLKAYSYVRNQSSSDRRVGSAAAFHA